MTSRDWFRRVTWTDDDRREFDARLGRCRSPQKAAQYLRIQAGHLAQAGHYEASVGLLERMLAECPARIQLAQAHAQIADVLAKLGELDGAIREYRAALQAEREFPNVHTNAWLDFGWFAVNRELTGIYDEVLQALVEFRDEECLKFPATEFRYCAVQALIADSRGDRASAAAFARLALREAARIHSGVSRHPRVGLVDSVPQPVQDRLQSLAAMVEG